MKCFYHNDADGKCAGFWVHNRAYLEPDIEFIEISYEKPFPMNTILPNEQIYIVDYSIMPNEMRELLKITKDGMDYDWSDIELDNDTIDRLIELYVLHKNRKENGNESC